MLKKRSLILALSLLHLLPAGAAVTIGKTADGPCLMVDGQPFWVRGVTFTIGEDPKNPGSQEAALADVKSLGANAIRTWGTGDDTGDLLDRAQRQGLKVLLGLWLEHGRNGNEGDGNLDYTAHDKRMKDQLERTLKNVEKYKNHPALLGWGIGNEVILNIATDEQKTAYAKYLQKVCLAVKKADPNHPVISVSAWTVSVPFWEAETPALDGYGINAYGPAAGGIPGGLAEHHATKPYLVTEFGPRGAYDSPQDSNGIVIEPSDKEKYDQLTNGWRDWIEGNRKKGCMGGFIFNYGDNFHPTSIWLDMFVNGCKRPAYSAARKAFTGEDPEDRGVEIISLLTGPKKATPEKWLLARIELNNPDQRKTTIRFVAVIQDGGWRERGRMIELKQEQKNETDYRIQAPAAAGRYRIYAIVQDDHRFISCASTSVIVTE
ncbi:MAG: hypothetical protein JXR25_03375 [Pontiellaceae bacterium]|nr:hypothetical protein [Pontiellaceae bacterium]MBN2783844.1 hypothetical protein [Pontiellaceae bacterium]